jgi:hypothetical protein
MLKVDEEWIGHSESAYPGIGEQIRSFEEAVLPVCSHCGSDNTANVQCGVIGRTIRLATATTKFKLLANGPKPGQFFCNACGRYFGRKGKQSATKRGPNLDESDLVRAVKEHGGFTVEVGGLKGGVHGKS